MANKAKPSLPKKQNGTFRADRFKRVDEKLAKGKPCPPSWLEDAERWLWDTVVSDLPSCLIGTMDEFQMTELVTMHAALRKLRTQFLEQPEDRAIRAAYIDIQKCFLRIANEYGLNPAARASMIMPEGSAEEDSPMLGLVAKFG